MAQYLFLKNNKWVTKEDTMKIIMKLITVSVLNGKDNLHYHNWYPPIEEIVLTLMFVYEDILNDLLPDVADVSNPVRRKARQISPYA